jgi:hypothetical protein
MPAAPTAFIQIVETSAAARTCRRGDPPNLLQRATGLLHCNVRECIFGYCFLREKNFRLQGLQSRARPLALLANEASPRVVNRPT